jgi:nitroreductase
MDAWDAITSRRNVREFQDRPIPSEDLDRILEAARRTPSSRNRQAWDFVVVTERATLEDLVGVWQGAWHVGGAAAAIMIVVPNDPDDASLRYDAGQAAMSILLAAAGFGVGGCHAAVRDQDLARQILGVPGDRLCVSLLSLGYPADRPLSPMKKMNRRPFDEVIHREHW